MAETAALNNAIHCVLDSSYIEDLAHAVTNDGCSDGARRWLLGRIGDYLRGRRQSDDPIAAFDFAWPDIEALGQVWPAFRQAAEHHPAGAACLPPLARFLFDRLPSVWDRREPWLPHRSVTRAVVLADNIDTLVGLFSIGLQPNGSKDPFALRRAARTVLLNITLPAPIGAA